MGSWGGVTPERGQTCLMNAQHSVRTLCNHFSGSRTHFPAKPRYIDIGAQISGRGRAGDGGGGGEDVQRGRRGGGRVSRNFIYVGEAEEKAKSQQ